MRTLALALLLLLATAPAPTASGQAPSTVSCPPDNASDCTTTVYVARYGRWLPIQTEDLAKLPCLNGNPDAILFEDFSIYCPEWGN